MGFESFTQLGYVRRNRNCYTSEDIRRFRQRIEQLVVPAVSIIKKSQSDRLGLDAIRLYDDVVFYEGTGGGGIVKARLLESLQGLFGSLSPTAGGYIRQMLEGRYYDLDARPGKKASSSCKYLPDRKIPFVFANFNGQTADVFLVIHEFGHGFSHYLTRQDPYAPVKPPTLDLCEVHSMGMEMLASPGGYGIFGREDRGQAEAAHLMDAFCFLPYGAMVDEFQHIIYEKPEMRPAQRNRCWLELEEKYRPHLDLSDLEYFAGGRGWQKQHHIYVSPFYYIDYCLAQITAFELWDEGRKDPGAAFRKYTAIAASGGDLNFCETLAKAGLKGPFASAALGNIILSVLDAIQKSPLPLIPDPNASLSKRPAP
jgi:M3 family oligoendopeptidase